MNKDELIKQSNNFSYCCDIIENDYETNNGQELIYNSFNKEIYDNLDIDNDDERFKIDNLNCNHEQNNHCYNEINNNIYNANIFQSFEQKPKKTEILRLDVGYPFDFKTNSIYDNIHNDVFYTTKTKMKTNLFVTTTLGKKKSRNDEIIGDNKKERRKFQEDNIIRKIKISYIDFIIGIINIIINAMVKKNNIKNNYKFYKLSHEYKNKTAKDFFNSFKTKTIEDVIKNQISSQYSTKKENSNEKTCEKIKKDEKFKDICKILNKNILFFFDKIYNKERKQKYNLKEFGLFDLEIILPYKVKLYEDLLSKNKNESKYNTYKSKMDLCCKFNFKLENDNPYFKTRKSK